MIRLPATSLFIQALSLVGATLIAVFLATTVVIFNIPPPAPYIYTVSEVAQVFRSGKPMQPAEGRALQIRRISTTPKLSDPPQNGGHRHLNFRQGLASALKTNIDNVVLEQDAPRAFYGPPPHVMHRVPTELGAPEQTVLFGEFKVAVRQPNGTWLMVSPRPELLQPWQVRILMVLAFSAIAVTPLAWWYARQLATPIAAFARGAERLGRDPDAPPLEDMRGSTEVVAAGAAFNLMQERLKRYVTNRTTMVGAIAHDLRTPLTRLRFRIEAAPEDLKAKLAADIDEMEAMISGTLAFVQDATRPVERTKLEVSSLVETVMDEAAETGRDAAVERAERAVVDGDPIALKRLVTNLVDNALKFGSRARGRVFAEHGMAVVEVDDDGPGVPESDIERAFEPFLRLEGSRSRETGGAGLGLAVVRAIARGHGGEVTLQNRAEGGLRARVTLPLAMRAGPRRQAAAANA